MTLLHVKITDHFSAQARLRLGERDASRLWRVIVDGRLFQMASKLRYGERGAACVGTDAVVVFCVDADDQGLVALLTVLSRSEVESLPRRRDTRMIRLPQGAGDTGRFGAVVDGGRLLDVYEQGAGLVLEPTGRESDGWRLELTLGEARRLHDDLGDVLGHYDRPRAKAQGEEQEV